jgi:hypothetical protein
MQWSTGFHQALNKPVHEDDADDKIFDVKAAHMNKPRLEEARRRWMDQRTLYRTTFTERHALSLLATNCTPPEVGSH